MHGHDLEVDGVAGAIEHPRGVRIRRERAETPAAVSFSSSPLLIKPWAVRVYATGSSMPTCIYLQYLIDSQWISESLQPRH